MRRVGVFLSTMVLAALILAACGGGATSTNVAGSPPAVTADTTQESSPTEGAAGTETASGNATTETAGVPMTGDVNPARLSRQLDLMVWSQDGEQVGEVDDMVLDLDSRQISYVVVGTGGFLDLGERKIPVPWGSLELQTGSGEATGGQQNVFVLTSDMELFSNAPDFDVSSLPATGEVAGDWDAEVRNYWQGGGAVSTPTADGTPAVDATATATSEAAGTPTPSIGPEQGHPLQGVVLASEILGADINWGAQGQGTNTGGGASQSTATASGAATEQGTRVAGTPTPGTGGSGPGVNQANTTGTIEDMIVGTDTGNILYIVITAAFDDGERWIPIPLSLFQWDGAAGVFNLNADTATLQGAPSFQNGQFPDTTTSGWNSDIDTFWQNNGG